MTDNLTPIERKTQADYDAIADAFARSRFEMHWKEVDDMIGEVPQGAKVLDIGCGTGRVCRFLSREKTVDYTGIDISDEQLKLAARDCPQGEFVNASMLDLPFEAASFDAVFMIASLHHLLSEEEHVLALREAARVLKPEGTLYVTVFGLWRFASWPFYFQKAAVKSMVDDVVASQMGWKDVFKKWSMDNGVVVHRVYHAFTIRELRRLTQTAGFIIKDIGYRNNGKRVGALRGKNLVLTARKMV